MEKRDSHFCHTKKSEVDTWRSHPNKFYIRSHLCSQNRPSRFVVLPGCLTVSPGKKKNDKRHLFLSWTKTGYRVTNAKNYDPIECSYSFLSRVFSSWQIHPWSQRILTFMTMNIDVIGRCDCRRHGGCCGGGRQLKRAIVWNHGRMAEMVMKILRSPKTNISNPMMNVNLTQKKNVLKFLPRKEIWQKKMTSLKHTHIKFAGDVGQFFRNLQTSIHQFELWSFRWNNDQSMDEKNDGSQYINLKKVIPSRSLT